MSRIVSNHWLNKRKSHWAQLEDLLQKCGNQGVKALDRRDLRELSLLYRQIAADLSILREDRSSQNSAHYLNQLLARTHNIIYTGRRGSSLGIIRFYTQGFPKIFRETFNYTMFAFVLFMAAAVAGMILTFYQPDFQLQVLGPKMVSTIERREMWTHSIVGIKPLASSAIMTNNIGVAFATFAAGITAGIGTTYMMLFNGLLIGVIGTSCWLSGMSGQLWSFVAPHGVLELPAIFIAGGAGLRIANGLLFPGLLSRRDSTAVAGLEAVKLLLGTIPMLFIAGIVEGFVSPSGIPASAKYALAGTLFVLLVTYLTSHSGVKPAKSGSAL